jgi:preprotein translocase subunit SecG
MQKTRRFLAGFLFGVNALLLRLASRREQNDRTQRKSDEDRFD